jgi:NADH-quinone oxidoreductase subunit M
VLAFHDGAPGTPSEIGGLALIVAAALIRKGILPFHAWLPAIFEHGRLGPPTLFCAPQLGTYVVAVLVRPRAPDELLRVVAALALATSVYAAGVALVQRSARRACAYLFMSQSALVMAGLDSSSDDAVAGALVLWLSASLAFAGLARSLLVLEARRGPLDLSKYHGGYERKPLLGSTFLVIGLSSAGFPGTLGFVGEELLLGGAVTEFPLLGFLVVISSALTGLSVMRMYLSLFCGVSPATVRLGLRPKEAVGFSTMALILVASGLAPKWIVSSRIAASAEMRRDSTAPRRPLLDHRPIGD